MLEMPGARTPILREGTAWPAVVWYNFWHRLRDGALSQVGDIRHTYGPALPGELVAGGQAISRLQFPDLFAMIGITYGAGDGSTTFNLPNLIAASPAPTAFIRVLP